MAYSPIKQSRADPATTSSQNLTLAETPSPRPADLPVALYLSYEDVSNDAVVHDAGTRPDNAESKVAKFLSSLSSSSRQSYDLVEDDDYEVSEQITPTLQKHNQNVMAGTTELSSPNPPRADIPMRTASIGRQLPLNHPMPDLQSIQGAYVRNVERLEETAERLSMKSGIEDEIQRIKEGQRQRMRTASGTSQPESVRSGLDRQMSIESQANPIVDVNTTSRSGGFSPAVYVASPVGSSNPPHSAHATSSRHISKSSRLATLALPEPELEGRPLDSDFANPLTEVASDLDPRPIHSPSPVIATRPERPTTSGSGDTYQQARTLFNDFDGVHFSPERNARASRRISLTRPPRARDSRAFKEPQPGEEMIYYPAPVPVMLNLPMRLSKMNWSEHEKKRLKALSSIPDDMRKSAAWLANEDGIPAPNPRSSMMLPPQLRASAFFDHRSATQDVQLKDGSAVATLDSILDAAAHAPVSAFTDHPFAGHLGNDFYSVEPPSRKSVQLPPEKKAKRKSSLSNLLKPGRSSGNLSEAIIRESRVPSVMLSKRDSAGGRDEEIEDDAEVSIGPSADELSEHEDGDNGEADSSAAESETHESQFLPGFSAAPTTLLAELQMRKAQQRSRNRTAVSAFPNGMHSTLLELDTVAQLQQRARKQKHVKLAWEDKDVVDRENFDDEEVPLGILFPEKEQQSQVNLHRPLGLMEKKELEENEPLSHRRARLRGEPIQAPVPSRSPVPSHHGEESHTPVLELPSLDQLDDDDYEGETLAQRRARMKNRKENGSSVGFARQVSTELGLRVEGEPDPLPSPSGSRTPEEEETLGQRRKRLQAEALQNGGHQASVEASNARPTLKTKRSLADVLQANPIGYVDPNEVKTAQSVMQSQERARERDAKYLAAQAADRSRTEAARNRFGNGNQGGLIQTSYNSFQGYQEPRIAVTGAYVPGTNNYNGFQANYAYPHLNTFGMQPGYNSAISVPTLPANYAYQTPMMQGYGYQPAMDYAGIGPPLDQKQRARIEGWRQGVN